MNRDDIFEMPPYADRLKWLREKRKLKRRVVAELCGLSKNMIARYENGEVEPKANGLLILADFYGVSVDFILGREEKEKNFHFSP